MHSTRYNTGAMLLHWLMALAIIGMITLGLLLEDIPSSWKPSAYQFHKALGITILFLSFFRLFWRLTHHVPPLPESMKRWQKTLAKTTHGLLYTLMITMPLSGWLYISTSTKNYPTTWFGLFEIPKLPVFQGEIRKAAHGVFGEAHELLAYGAIGLISLHVLAALYHQFALKDGVLLRMLPRCGCSKATEKTNA